MCYVVLTPSSLCTLLWKLCAELLKYVLKVSCDIIFSDEELEKMQQSPTMLLAREVGSPTHKVQLMKSSFFMEQEGDLESGKCVCSYKFL